MAIKTGLFEKETFFLLLKTLDILCCVSKENSQAKFLIKFILVMLISAFNWFGVLIHFLINVIYKGPANFSEDLALVLSVASLQMATIFFTYHNRKWLRLLRKMTDFSKFGKPQTFGRVQRNCNYFCGGFLAFNSISACIYGYTRIRTFGLPLCRKLKEDEGLYEYCGTLFPMWLPFDDHSIALKMVIIAVQIISVNLMLYASSCVGLLSLHGTELLITHIDHFKTVFNEVFQERDPNEMKRKFNGCVKYHLYILSISRELSYLSKVTLGHYSLVSAIAIGCLGNQIVKKFSIGGFLHLLWYLLGMFIFCYAGQKIMDETAGISDSIYSSKWYLAKPKMVLDVKFMMARSQIPICIEALPLGILNFPLYLMILKTSYSYLTLLNETT